MAKPNYEFAKRQRDLAKKQKKEEKRKKKLESGEPAEAAPEDGTENYKNTDPVATRSASAEAYPGLRSYPPVRRRTMTPVDVAERQLVEDHLIQRVWSLSPA